MAFNIQQFIDHNYTTDIRVARRKGSGGTQEFFTPYPIVKRMCDKIPDEEVKLLKKYNIHNADKL